MRWKSWLLPRAERFRVVAGLDLSSDACQLVILSGSQMAANAVCSAECLEVPEGWISQGQIVQPDLLGRWLREHVAEGGHDVAALCMGVDEAWISNHEVVLTAGLSDEDIAFQLSVEMQLLMSEADVCVDFQQMHPAGESEEASLPELQTYQVRALPRSQLTLMSQMAKSAGLELAVVEGRRDATRRMQSPEILRPFSTANLDLALQCEVALGLALAAWQVGAFNFVPHRARAQDELRRAWYTEMAAWAVCGFFFAAGVTWVLSSVADRKQSALGDVTQASRALDAASQAHTEAQALYRAAEEQRRWLLARQMFHQHTLQWAHVLNQSTEGLWVSGVTQQNTQWRVQGEALTSAHAHVLMMQLSQLDIWVRSPEMRQLQLLPSTASKGLPVWQFQMDAELKGGL